MGCLKLTYHHDNTNASNLRVAYKSDSLNRRNPETKNSQKLRSDHLVFGWDMPGRSYTAQSYKFGYQGSEREKEYMGGAAYTTYFRGLDPRVGRWFSTDVVNQPWQSPYCSMNNNPITLIDLLGADAIRDKSRYGGLNREGVWERGRHNRIESGVGGRAAIDVLRNNLIERNAFSTVAGAANPQIMDTPKTQETIFKNIENKNTIIDDTYMEYNGKEIKIYEYNRDCGQYEVTNIYYEN